MKSREHWEHASGKLILGRGHTYFSILLQTFLAHLQHTHSFSTDVTSDHQLHTKRTIQVSILGTKSKLGRGRSRQEGFLFFFSGTLHKCSLLTLNATPTATPGIISASSPPELPCGITVICFLCSHFLDNT